MGIYRALWNVQTSAGTFVPGSLVELPEVEAVKLAASGAIDPVAVAGPAVLGPDDRLTALAAFVPRLMLGDMSHAGALTPAGEARILAAIGFVPTIEELRSTFEAFARSRAGVLGMTGIEVLGPGGFNSTDPAIRAHGEAAAASPTTEAVVRGESSGLSVDERRAALLTAVAALPPETVVNSAGLLKADARRRLAGQLGFEIADDELRAAIEAAKAKVSEV